MKPMSSNTMNRLSWRALPVPVGVSSAYLLLSAWLVGFKVDQLVLAGLFGCAFIASEGSKRWVLGFSIFIVYWVLFDWMKAFPNYAFNPVHIGDLYEAERSLFGIRENGAVLTPNELLALGSTPLKDVLAGLFYLCWVPVPLAFAGYLYAKDKGFFLRFSLCFVLVNLLGFVVYYLYPAAPPWYVAQSGVTFDPETPGNTAGLGRFDDLIGLPIFQGLYSKSSNVFAAMPSLHASYLVVAAYWAHRAGLRRARVLFAVLAAGIWWAAVYSGHHYILDVIMGIACAILGIGVFNILSRRAGFARWMERYRLRIEAPAQLGLNTIHKQTIDAGLSGSTSENQRHRDHVSSHH